MTPDEYAPKETVWYFEKDNLILVKSVSMNGSTIWTCEDNGFYWSNLLDEIPNFVFLGDL